MLKAHETTCEEYNTTSRSGPKAGPQMLSNDPLWLEVCEKMGHSPTEWQNYRLPIPDWDGCRSLMEEQELEQAIIRAEYDAALAYLLAVVKFAPEQVRKALGAWECESGDA